MRISGTMWTAALALSLTACGNRTEQPVENEATPNASVAAPVPEVEANVVESANAATPEAEPETDVTAAGFPFKTGTYVTEGRCAPDNYSRYEFAKKYRHEYEADQQQDFTRIIRLEPGKYRIREHVEADEKVDNWDATVTYTASGPDGFTTDEQVVDYNAKGEAVPRKGQYMHYKWCSDASLGIVD